MTLWQPVLGPSSPGNLVSLLLFSYLLPHLFFQFCKTMSLQLPLPYVMYLLFYCLPIYTYFTIYMLCLVTIVIFMHTQSHRQHTSELKIIVSIHAWKHSNLYPHTHTHKHLYIRRNAAANPSLQLHS